MSSLRSLSTLLFLGALAPLAGCAPAAPRTEPTPDRVVMVQDGGAVLRQNTGDEISRTHFDATPDKVWAAVAAAYMTVGIPANVVDRANGKYGNGGFIAPRQMNSRRIADYFSCGQGITGPLIDRGRVVATVITTVSASSGGGTDAQTWVTGVLRQNDGSSSGVNQCNTTGRLEEDLRAAIAAKLATP